MTANEHGSGTGAEAITTHNKDKAAALLHSHARTRVAWKHGLTGSTWHPALDPESGEGEGDAGIEDDRPDHEAGSNGDQVHGDRSPEA